MSAIFVQTLGGAAGVGAPEFETGRQLTLSYSSWY